MQLRITREQAALPIDELSEIYGACLYRAAPEDCRAALLAHLMKPAVCCFAALDGNRPVGLLTVQQTLERAEILGIAVHPAGRGQGVGRAMILRAQSDLAPLPLTAETDDDAVNFYRRCGFACEAFSRAFPDGTVRRWRCILA